MFDSVELFYNSCQEMDAWIHEKEGLLCDRDVGRDIETVRALQRRHQVILAILYMRNDFTDTSNRRFTLWRNLTTKTRILCAFSLLFKCPFHSDENTTIRTI